MADGFRGAPLHRELCRHLVPAAARRKERTHTFATLGGNLVRFHGGHTVDIRLAIEHGSRLVDCMKSWSSSARGRAWTHPEREPHVCNSEALAWVGLDAPSS